MRGSRRLTLVTNIVLGLIVVAVGAVCFFPPGVSTAGKVSDRVYYSGNTDSRYVSLMFNVYGGAEYIPSILDSLDQYGVRATFFIGGCWADDYGETVREIDSRGNELANHGYFHKDQDKLSLNGNKEEISRCGDLVEMLTGKKTVLFAPPSGAYSENTVNAAEDLGYKVIMWSKDTVDWRDHDATLIYNRATKDLAGGDLILMHPTKETAEALPSVLRNFAENGFLQVPVSVNISGVEKA